MKHLHRNLLLCLIFFSGTVLASTLEQQRNDFVRAEKSLAQGDRAAFMRISAGLLDYPLYPYLQYQWLKDNLQQTDAIQAFLTAYKDSRYAGLLRTKWLGYLAENQRWHDFIRHYQATSNMAIECQHRLAVYSTGDKRLGISGAKRLWLTGDALPKECDPLWSVLMLSPDFSPELVWQRFELALGKDNVAVAESVRRLLPPADQLVADSWLQVHKKPTLIETNGFLTAFMGRLFAHGVSRLAKSDLNLAVKLWDERRQAFQLDVQTAQQLERQLALSLARNRHAAAYHRLSQLSVIDTEINEWKLRAALLEQNWAHVAETLSGLTAKERLEPKWQYWQARALEKSGDTVQAQAVYTKLAEDRSFYGFMAADIVSKPYQFANNPLLPAENELENLANALDFKMVRELKALNRNAEAERQWWYAIKKLDNERLMLAAKLAQRWHWDQVAITTLVKADYWDDLGLRFPVYYADQVRNNALLQQVDPAIVFGLIRQESIFNKDAKSAVGARGLMQIMPKTGMQIARELKEKWQSEQSLFSPDVNVRYGAFYYKKLLNRFQGHVALAAAAYNAGQGRVAKWLPSDGTMPADIWIETIPFKETRKYVTSVLAYAIIYQELMQRKDLKIKELMSDVRSG
ncbi:MAG: transglycosylase SLT domain-containing protein [Methylobacter sp.]|nr:transglycosylase SLT domain-containing protein [Methylobacter sp.]MDP2099073.1 transglycosylase SLT domain-containing protein [Methylobacter sp.]MDP2429482.1 transglycosylase SLT domain-containing protein [Methylobacter sp.]MDP3055488.1 transglycosylase SLT domain-containing protein [Methylobacter sp.]MDP3361868.1 transglycosylase SLT domain-containing protein [Methylobacter sp.]